MNYQIYKNARDTAWNFLIENNVTSLPIVFSGICRTNNIKLMRYVGDEYFADDERGVAYFDNGSPCILVNGNDELCVQRYTIAHELGHIYLGHLSSGNSCHRLSGTRNDPRNSSEYQAERFAMNILAPACVLWALNVRTPKDISELCDISIYDAAIRAERMGRLYKRNKFLSSELEKKVYENFKPFIIRNFRRQIYFP